MLKYTDKEGALVTMTSRQDIQIYVTELITQYQRQHQQMGGPKLNANQLPPMKVQVVKVALEVRQTHDQGAVIMPVDDGTGDGLSTM